MISLTWEPKLVFLPEMSNIKVVHTTHPQINMVPFSSFIHQVTTHSLQDSIILNCIMLDRHSRLEDTPFISIWLVQFTSLTVKDSELIKVSTELSPFMELTTSVWWTMSHSMWRVTPSSLKMQLRRRTTSTRISSWRPRGVGHYSTLIRHPHASGLLTQTITSSRIIVVVQIDMPIGMIYKNTQLDPMPIPTSALRTKELVHSETITLILVVDMVSEFSIIWSLENSHARVSLMTLTI